MTARVTDKSLPIADGLRLMREAARLFRDLCEALEHLMKAERLHFGEPTAILGLQVDQDTLRFLHYVDEMTPPELEVALQTGRLPNRLDAAVPISIAGVPLAPGTPHN